MAAKRARKSAEGIDTEQETPASENVETTPASDATGTSKTLDQLIAEGQLPRLDSSRQAQAPAGGYAAGLKRPDPFSDVDLSKAELSGGTPGAAQTAPIETKSPAQPVLPTISDQFTDPHSIEQISITAEPKGPMMRLLRNHKLRSLEMQFDEKPPAEITQTLRSTGWEWKGREKVWVKFLDDGIAWRSVADAEKQFREIGNTLREMNGLEPVAQLRVGA